MLLLSLNPNFDWLKMGTSGHASSLDWGKILRKRDKLGGVCLVIGGEFVWVKLVCGVMQKIAVGAVCWFLSGTSVMHRQIN